MTGNNFVDEDDRASKCFGKSWKQILRDKVPILEWLPKYTLTEGFHDILAGFTVALTGIPQGIAYAIVAGLTPEYGLYAGFMGGIIYFFLGTCKDVNIGPASLMALMLQEHVLHLGPAMAVLITFVSGVIILILGMLNLGFLIEFFSYPVIAGFTSAASLEIASCQLNNLLGIPGRPDTFIEAMQSVFGSLKEIKLWDTALGVVCLILLFFLREVRRFGTLKHREDWSWRRNAFGMFVFVTSLAGNAIVVVIATVLSYGLRENLPFAITKHVNTGLPPLKPPPFSTVVNGTTYSFMDMAKEYNTAILFYPLIIILESVSIAKAFSKGKPINATQEMLALGVSNLMSSFVSSMPVTGSFTRTAVNNASGAKTTASSLVASLIVLLAVEFLTSTFYYIPKATLAAVIICAMFYLFEFEAFPQLWKSKKSDLLPFLATFLSCLFVSLENGILIGIVVNLLFVLYPTARPKLNLTTEKIADQEVIVITPKNTLFYPAADYLRKTVLECEKDVTVIIDGKYIGSIDVTVAKCLVGLLEEMEVRGQKFFFFNFKESVVKVCTALNENVEAKFKSSSLEEGIKEKEEV